MKISGHKTDSMERRYNIVDAEDLQHGQRAAAEPPQSLKDGLKL